jgi:hypothetical protein
MKATINHKIIELFRQKMHVALAKKVDNDDAILTQKDYSLAFAAPSHDYPLLFWWAVAFKCLWST